MSVTTLTVSRKNADGSIPDHLTLSWRDGDHQLYLHGIGRVQEFCADMVAPKYTERIGTTVLIAVNLLVVVHKYAQTFDPALYPLVRYFYNVGSKLICEQREVWTVFAREDASKIVKACLDAWENCDSYDVRLTQISKARLAVNGIDDEITVL